MQKYSFRRLLASAGCMALCLLILGSLPSAAQPKPLPTECLPIAPASTPPPNCHVVRVGPPTLIQSQGDTIFQDLDSGSRSTDPALGGQNPVLTVIPVGHTVQWQFFYQHSSTAGNCDAPISIDCIPTGQWDSGIKSGRLPIPTSEDLHNVTFTQPGVFTYFCEVHFSLMRGIVVVLANAQDYDLFGNPDPTLRPPPPMPTRTIFAGDSVSFAGNLNSYKGFSSTLTLTCASGNPRNPSGCPTVTTTVVPAAGAFFATQPFTFPVSETTGGTYLFDIVANPQPASALPFPHKKKVLLNVNDLGLTLGESSLTALRGETLQTTARANGLGQFGGNVSMSCSVSPPGGPNCAVTPSSFALSPGATQNLTINLTNTTVISNNYTFSVAAASSATNPGPGAFSLSKSLALALKPAERLIVTSAASSVAPGQSLSITVRAVNRAGTQMTNYNSTIQFTSSEPLAALPSPYLFVPADNGLKTFNVTLNTVGPQSITVTDTSPFATTGTSTIIRVDSADTNNTITLEPVPAPLQDAFFRSEQVTFMATVQGTPGIPAGSVQFYDGAKPVGAPVALQGTTSSKTASKTFSLGVGDHAISAVFLPSSGSFTANMSDMVMQRRFPSPRCVNSVCPGSR
jgi:plastocyanin